MVRALLDEARLAPLDDAGRRSLKAIHEKSLHELEGILSDDLRKELADVTLRISVLRRSSPISHQISFNRFCNICFIILEGPLRYIVSGYRR